MYDEFERNALKLRIDGKRKYYSIRAILHKIRWDTLFCENDDSGYKISNYVTPYISRLLMISNKDLSGMFKTKFYDK